MQKLFLPIVLLFLTLINFSCQKEAENITPQAPKATSGVRDSLSSRSARFDLGIYSQLFVIAGDRLKGLNPEYGNSTLTDYGTGFTGTKAMVGYGDGNFMFVRADGRLEKYNIVTGARGLFGTGIWSATTAMAYDPFKKLIYIVEGDTLYRLNPNDASVSVVGHDYTGTKFMQFCRVGFGYLLFVLHGTQLWAIGPENGAATALPGDWSNSLGMASDGRYLYINNSGRMWRVDPSNNGSWQDLNRAATYSLGTEVLEANIFELYNSTSNGNGYVEHNRDLTTTNYAPGFGIPIYGRASVMSRIYR